MTRRRRALMSVAGAAALVAASSAMLLAPTAASAAPTTTSSSSTSTSTTVPSTSLPAGKVTVQAGATFHLVEAGKATAIAFTGTMVGTSDGNGHLTFPKSAITFDPVSLTVPVPTTVHLVATTDFAGTINTQTGAVTLAGSSETLIDIPALSATSCPLGPSAAHLSSANTGGVKYNSTAHTATVTDTTFVIPAITTAPASCPAAAIATINGTFPLPISGSTPRSIVETLKVFPPGVAVTAAATSTTVSPTTAPAVAAAATPTTAAPNTLPRTGGSSGPLAFLGLSLLGGGLALGLRRRRNPARP
ncbi:MAG TPA: LPXTG cell wall anchor domain-containing protein [Acidimicrobiia bacterium]